jgi:uncharacterized membrane protein
MADIDSNDMKTNGHIAYGLFAASLLVGITGLVGIVFCYLKRSAFEGALWQSHMTWLIRTFWISFIGALASMLLMFVAIGFLTILTVVVWFIYRIVKGWILWNDDKPIEAPEGLF